MMRMSLFIILIFIFVNQILSQNATDCVDMYLNKTITTPCIDNTTCCFIHYWNLDQNFTRCLMKLNATDDLCPTLKDSIEFYMGYVDICDCFTIWMNSSFNYIFILVFVIYFL